MSPKQQNKVIQYIQKLNNEDKEKILLLLINNMFKNYNYESDLYFWDQDNDYGIKEGFYHRNTGERIV